MSTEKSKKRKIVPLGDRVLVRIVEAETRTKSGIIIPDTVNKERPEQGMVVAVGAGRTTDEGKTITPKVKVGDVVIFSKYGPDEIKLDGEEYYILSELNVLAVVK
ncbi:MAG: co-chaperone GroES [Candidatus Yonathbacteria bacterium RIFCSPHIGHO2_01_FULL_44_41]|uniref:Co-chaperonin GroES n=1 Tax=Candidatus Yonathbacteria bacterium RIFCSPHIGHO2_02_FULL_44_14 TaxID=1802724 RepID=A0A1G2S9S6_9BACT|nr:MAG: co-chaperone GroES [Candidatus Yonathbacteria bacterium RIFCSPHIGHO2_01_FULL_44_41]OHA81459.1 MAG: co-chaperone GroES [Candidatus Yonathbacteria bacterium RIFCSPHIGHO2_02_FULL_44_14]OHA81979.1 MAG: co-chaperone GroES [Candidatus Yonathbacteria bacterium RIFCSPLOWO2_01_FULL_43_20]